MFVLTLVAKLARQEPARFLAQRGVDVVESLDGFDPSARIAPGFAAGGRGPFGRGKHEHRHANSETVLGQQVAKSDKALR